MVDLNYTKCPYRTAEQVDEHLVERCALDRKEFCRYRAMQTVHISGASLPFCNWRIASNLEQLASPLEEVLD